MPKPCSGLPPSPPSPPPQGDPPTPPPQKKKINVSFFLAAYPLALSSRSQCKGLSGKQLLVVRTHTRWIESSERLKGPGEDGDGRRSGCYVGVLSSNGFSSFALFSPFYLLGSLMGADLTTGAGTSAGKDEPPQPLPPAPFLAHAVVC